MNSASRHLAAVLAVAVLLVAACGTSSNDASTAATITTTVSTTTVSAPSAVADTQPDTAPPPPGDAGGNALTDGPMSPGEHGPFSASDTDRDGTVTRAEIEAFMDAGPERRIGLVAFFRENDLDGDEIIDEEELAEVQPAFAFDGTDANADGVVSLAEVEDYVNEPGRLYRAIGLGEFFDLVDTDDNDEVSPDEIEAAHESGQLERG